MSMLYRLRASVTRALWRLAAPEHPRGWLDVEALPAGEGSVQVRTRGMNRFGLPDLELTHVPADLQGVAHGLLIGIAAFGSSSGSLKADSDINAALSGAQQLVLHRASLRHVPRPGTEVLRVVDPGAPAASGFASRLFAAQLIVMSETRRSARARIDLLKRAVALYPPEHVPDGSSLEMAQNNPGNYFAWESLGFAFAACGDAQAAVHAFETAARVWPVGAAHTGEQIVKDIASGKLADPERDPVSRFWRDWMQARRLE